MSESTSPGLQAGAEETGGSPSAEPQVKDSLEVDQLTACVEDALSLEEEVLCHLSDSMDYSVHLDHSGLPGGVPDVGSEPFPIGSSGNRITPAEVPPSSAANSNIPS